MQEWLLSVMFCLVNSTIPREPAPASFIFKVQCPICIVVLQLRIKIRKREYCLLSVIVIIFT
jgi:hypothetical protein